MGIHERKERCMSYNEKKKEYSCNCTLLGRNVNSIH
nr:MAG TPA: hypothetical protein [Caudoviricetes sp.]